MSLELLSEKLRTSGYSTTKPRILIFTLLIGKSPLSVKELLELIDSAIDKASVYRTLGLFEKLGVTQRVNSGWKYKLELTDLFAAHHHHLHCKLCGKTETTHHSTELEKLIEELAIKSRFNLEAHQLELYGICKKCRG